MSRKMPPEPFKYCAGGAPGSRLVMISISRAPISPRATRVWASEKVGSKRRWKPIMQATPAACTATAHPTARATDKSTGFSQKICLPACAARWIRSLWVSVGEAITTASMLASASTASGVETVAPS